MHGPSAPTISVLRSGGDRVLSVALVLGWIALLGYVGVKLRLEAPTELASLVGVWVIGLIAIFRFTWARVRSVGPVLVVRNGLRTRRFDASEIRSFGASSLAHGHWVVKMRTSRGHYVLHATDRRNQAAVDRLVGDFEGWLLDVRLFVVPPFFAVR